MINDDLCLLMKYIFPQLAKYCLSCGEPANVPSSGRRRRLARLPAAGTAKTPSPLLQGCLLGTEYSTSVLVWRVAAGQQCSKRHSSVPARRRCCPGRTLVTFTARTIWRTADGSSVLTTVTASLQMAVAVWIRGQRPTRQ